MDIHATMLRSLNLKLDRNMSKKRYLTVVKDVTGLSKEAVKEFVQDPIAVAWSVENEIRRLEFIEEALYDPDLDKGLVAEITSMTNISDYDTFDELRAYLVGDQE